MGNTLNDRKKLIPRLIISVLVANVPTDTIKHRRDNGKTTSKIVSHSNLKMFNFIYSPLFATPFC